MTELSPTATGRVATSLSFSFVGVMSIMRLDAILPCNTRVVAGSTSCSMCYNVRVLMMVQNHTSVPNVGQININHHRAAVGRTCPTPTLRVVKMLSTSLVAVAAFSRVDPR